MWYDDRERNRERVNRERVEMRKGEGYIEEIWKVKECEGFATVISGFVDFLNAINGQISGGATGFCFSWSGKKNWFNNKSSERMLW